MGCTLAHFRRGGGGDSASNVFKVFNVDKEGVYRNPGKIEITDSELVFHHKNKEPIRWPLRYLRRYGFDSELFSFESGRRCPTGPGIYAFKCSKADSLFNLLQDSIQRAGHQDMDMAARPVAVPHDHHTTMSVAETQTGTGDIDGGRLVAANNTLHPTNHFSLSNTRAQSDFNNGGMIALQAFPQISNSQHEYFNADTTLHSATVGGGDVTNTNIDLSRQVSLQSEPEMQIQYAQLDLGGVGGGGGGDSNTTPTVDDYTESSQAMNYMNMPKPGGATGMSLSSSVPLIEAPPLPPLLEEDDDYDSGAESSVNYLNLYFKTYEGLPNGDQSPRRPVDTANSSIQGQSGSNSKVGQTVSKIGQTVSKGQALPKGEGYAVIDFNKTAAISATMSTKQLPEEEGGRKTRHNSNSQHPLSL